MGICEELPALARAELVDRCGEDKLWQLERMEKHTWRGWLTDGSTIIVMVLPDGSVKIWEQKADNMVQNIVIEREVRCRLAAWFGRRRVEQVEPVDSSCWRARLVDGGLAYATVEEDGSITIRELEAVC